MQFPNSSGGGDGLKPLSHWNYAWLRIYKEILIVIAVAEIFLEKLSKSVNYALECYLFV